MNLEWGFITPGTKDEHREQNFLANSLASPLRAFWNCKHWKLKHRWQCESDSKWYMSTKANGKVYNKI